MKPGKHSPKNPVDADKLLAASHGEFVEGISDPNDPKWVKGIETRDSVNQNQHESEQNEPETKQPEPEEQQEPEKSAPPAVRPATATVLTVAR